MKQRLQTVRPNLLPVAAVAGLMLCAAVVRWMDIGTESLWVDEIYSYRQAIKPFANIIANAAADVHPPVYYMLLRAWTLLFGTSEAGLRGLSAFCAVLSVPLIYVLGARLWTRRVGVYAAFLLTISHFHIHYAQEARSYSYVVLVTLAGMLTFVRLLDEIRENDALQWHTVVLFIGANVLLMYSHFFALFITVAQNVYVALLLLFDKTLFRRIWKRWFVLQVALLLIFVPWLNILYWQIRAVSGSFWIDKPNVFSIVETIIEYCGSLWASLFMLPLAAFGFVEIRKQQSTERVITLTFPKPEYSLLLVLWLTLPILIPFAKSLVGTPIYYVKYTIPALPALLLLVAKGMDAWEYRNIAGKIVLAGVVTGLSIIAGYDTVNDWNALEKERWREAAAYLQTSNALNDSGAANLVFVHDWYCLHNLAYYGARNDASNGASNSVCNSADLRALPPERLRMTTELWEKLYHSQIVGRNEFHLVLSHKTAKTPPILSTIEQDFMQVSDTVFPSRYRKYMVSDSFPQQTRGLFLMKTYLSNDIRIVRYRRKI